MLFLTLADFPLWYSIFHFSLPELACDIWVVFVFCLRWAMPLGVEVCKYWQTLVCCKLWSALGAQEIETKSLLQWIWVQVLISRCRYWYCNVFICLFFPQNAPLFSLIHLETQKGTLGEMDLCRSDYLWWGHVESGCSWRKSGWWGREWIEGSTGQGNFQRTQDFRGAEVPTPQAFRGAQTLGLNLQPPHPGGTYSYFHSLSLWETLLVDMSDWRSF